MGKIAPWKCVAGDTVKFAMNNYSFKKGNFLKGKIIERIGKFALIKSEQLPTVVRIHVSCLEVINTVLTPGRAKKQLSSNFTLKQTNGHKKKAKAKVTNQIGDMTFTYRK